MRIDYYKDVYYIGDVNYNDEPHGKGTFYITDGNKYVGDFRNGLFSGKGTLYFADGAKYEGEWRDGKFHGNGKFYYANGDVQEREYLNGELISSKYIKTGHK